MLKHQIFKATEPARFNLVVVHGMVEHSLRYAEFAQYMAEQGGNVITFDLRGHGQYHQHRDSTGDFGHTSFGGAQQIFTDITTLFESLPDNLPRIVLGHSMGAAIALRYIELNDNVKQAILTGIPAKPAWLMGLSHQLAKLEHRIRADKPSMFNQIFTQYNRQFAPNLTEFDWLSVRTENVENYIKDPLCGFKFTPKGYMDMFEFMREAFDVKNISLINPSTSVLALWGAQDPATDNGRGPRRLCEQLSAAGLSVAQIEYPELRHEILNEDNRLDVYADIAQLIQA